LRIPAEEAGIILTTCHAAKGMEWDHVQVLNDMIHLATVSKDGPSFTEGKQFVMKKRQTLATESSRQTW
jgi:superfamily I DNA/RNA helicase